MKAEYSGFHIFSSSIYDQITVPPTQTLSPYTKYHTDKPWKLPDFVVTNTYEVEYQTEIPIYMDIQPG